MLNSQAGKRYTWQQAKFRWEHPTAHKPWELMQQENYSLAFNTPLVIHSQPNLATTLAFTPCFAIQHLKINKHCHLHNHQALIVHCTYSDIISFLLHIREELNIKVLPRKNIQPRWHDTLTLALLAWQKRINKIHYQSINYREQWQRIIHYQRIQQTHLNLKETQAQHITIPQNTPIKFIEQYRRHANAILSDLTFGSTELDQATFQALLTQGSPPGYTAFRNFIPGDYVYESAIMRIIMESTNSDRAYIQDLKLAIDVPDILDRGTGIITNAEKGASIKFTRHFSTVPQVTVTPKGGIDKLTIPKITQIKNTGFKVVLQNKRNSLTTGTFTWIAQGY